jgi:4-amino-4-deoxychorismate lyase
MYWYDGTFRKQTTLELPIDEPGLLYGATVFTTLRVYEQSLEHPGTNWQAHRDRVTSSLSQLHWQVPDWSRIYQGAETLASTYPVLRITIFPDGREWIIGRALPANLNQFQQQGITAWVTSSQDYERSLPQHKSGNYLTPWLAKQQAQAQGAQEAILTDVMGNWLETSTGNLWGHNEQGWWTPPLGDILPGIARSRLLQILDDVHQTPWTAALVATFDCIAYTNSVVEMIPIHTVIAADKQNRYQSQHPALTQLKQGYQLLEQDIQPFTNH